MRRWEQLARIVPRFTTVSVLLVSAIAAATADPITTYTYDSLGRINRPTFPDSTQTSITYSFDLAGNRTQQSTQSASFIVVGNAAANLLAGQSVSIAATAIAGSLIASTLTFSQAGPQQCSTCGTLTNGGSALSYTASGSAGGLADSFPFTIIDSQGHTATGTISLVIVPLAPVANAIDVTNYSGNAVVLTPTVTDPQGSTLTLTMIDPPQQGVAISGENITYTPPPGGGPSVMFTYTVTNAFGLSASASVTIIAIQFSPAFRNKVMTVTPVQK